ncbi:hypothetical protein [Streptomyces sp. NPDC127033]|uniref:SbtR family transcriptional regulator n=1 Tax=Streptomyces sp. NPDC127033 TaxID=3347110 RepID=UPI003647D3F7
MLVEDDPWEGFVRFLTTALERMAGDRGLREVIFSEMHGRPEAAEARRRLLPAAAAVMCRAQDAGALRPDLAAPDLPLMPVGDWSQGINATGGAGQLSPPGRVGMSARCEVCEQLGGGLGVDEPAQVTSRECPSGALREACRPGRRTVRTAPRPENTQVAAFR